MKKYKINFTSTQKLIEQVEAIADKLKKTKIYVGYTAETILELFNKIKQLNIELSKLEVEEKSLKHDTYRIKDMQKDKEEERNKFNKILEVGLNDFVFKIDILLDDIRVIYLNILTFIYRKYNELVKLTRYQKDMGDKILFLREQIKNIVREIYETAAAKEETVIIKDIFEGGRRRDIAESIRKETLDVEKLEQQHDSVLKQIEKELNDVHSIIFDASILVPEIEEIIPKIDSETYLLENDTEAKVNKCILLLKNKIDKVKFSINNQAKLLYEEVKVI